MTLSKNAQKRNATDKPLAPVSPVQNWLEKCSKTLHAEGAALLIRQGNKVSCLAALPSKQKLDHGIVIAVKKALRTTKAVVLRSPSSHTSGIAYVAFTIRISGRPAAVGFCLQVENDLHDDELLKSASQVVLKRADDTVPQRHAGRLDVPHLKSDSEGKEVEKDKNFSSGTDALVAEQRGVISATAALLDHPTLTQSLHDMVNVIARQFGCLTVTCGLIRSRRVVIEAISGQVEFDRRTALMVDTAQALEETYSAQEMLELPSTDGKEAPPQCHAALATQLKNPALLSVPLVEANKIVGVLLLERDQSFSEQEKQRVERLALALAPIVKLKKIDDLSLYLSLKRLLFLKFKALVGSNKVGLKLCILVLVALVISSSLYTTTFQVDADAAIEASTKRAVVTSTPGFLREVEKKAGDIVHRGDVLARLDVEELTLERVRWVGERDKLVKEYRATLAQRDRSQVRVLEARRAQAQSRIDLLDAQITRGTLSAPIDGVVISGDLSQQLGSPVERGELLFEVASLSDYRLVLMVDEADVGDVSPGQQGRIRLRSLPDETFPFKVTSIAPVSETGAGANRFRVECSIEALPSNLRPGMAGVAKIEIEPRSIAWIWTRSFVNWVRLKYWVYGG